MIQLQRILPATVILTICFASSVCSQEHTWKDPSPHRALFVRVEDAVQIEVLDWGGQGRAVVLLAGSGNSAHVFDEFAGKLTDNYHLYGITRRGYGQSTHAETGYSAERLGNDVLAVLDKLQLDAPVLVGHSLGGHELTAVASAHPGRVAGLVYMDSTADPTVDWKPYQNLRKNLPQSMSYPQPSREDFRSFRSYRDWQKRAIAITFPESELRSVFEANPDGSIGRYRAANGVQDAIFVGMKKPDYSKVGVPVLAFFALPQPLEQQRLRHGPRNADERTAMEKVYAADIEHVRSSIDRLRKGAPAARVVELPGANHHVFLSNEAEVVSEIRAFLALLSKGSK